MEPRIVHPVLARDRVVVVEVGGTVIRSGQLPPPPSTG
jgi:hypothetical protein